MSARRLVAVCAILAAGAISASPAGAAKKQPFCSVVANLGTDVGSGASGSQKSGAESKRLGKAFKSASKKADAPKKVTKALSTIGDFYDALSKAKNSADYAALTARNAQKYATAASTFSQHYVQECSLASTTTTRSSSTSPSTTAAGGSTTTGGSSTTRPASGAGAVAGAFNGAPVNVAVAACSLSGSSGSVRSTDGSFQLTWSGSTYTLVWTVGGATYNGPVTAQLSASTVVFTGTAGAVTVQAVLACA